MPEGENTFYLFLKSVFSVCSPGPGVSWAFNKQKMQIQRVVARCDSGVAGERWLTPPFLSAPESRIPTTLSLSPALGVSDRPPRPDGRRADPHREAERRTVLRCPVQGWAPLADARRDSRARGPRHAVPKAGPECVFVPTLCGWLFPGSGHVGGFPEPPGPRGSRLLSLQFFPGCGERGFSGVRAPQALCSALTFPLAESSFLL